MTLYLLDTTVLIDLSKNIASVRSQLRALFVAGDEFGVCAINVAEFFAGLAPEERPRWERFIRDLRYWDITPEAAMRAGSDRYFFARQGRTISTQDSLVAAVAVTVGATILTSNVKEFPLPEVTTRSQRTQP